jgi:hypothetical protein
MRKKSTAKAQLLITKLMGAERVAQAWPGLSRGNRRSLIRHAWLSGGKRHSKSYGDYWREQNSLMLAD